MDDKTLTCLILLTYKGKALLMYKMSGPLDAKEHEWCFIGGEKDGGESFEEAMARRVEKEASIKIEEVEFISENCYHARLTDDNVNKIERGEGQLLDFFTLGEVQKLHLSEPTRQFVSKHGSLI
ncbi:MAG: NUDIX hydrolase [Candidatus Levybacteria bacterium]|nr:NUDIX hydrolase [Candidatus Levybacteria bacterium]